MRCFFGFRRRDSLGLRSCGGRRLAPAFLSGDHGDRMLGVPAPPFVAGERAVHAMLLADYAHNPLLADDEGSIAGAVVQIGSLLHVNATLFTSAEQYVLCLCTANKSRVARHYIQHMDGEAAGVAAIGLPIWASFSWIVLKEKDSERKQHFEMLMYMPGRPGSCQVPVVNPLGREYYDTIDHIQLSTYGGSINISELVRVISRFEITLMPAIKSAESTGTRDGNGLIRVVPGSAASA